MNDTQSYIRDVTFASEFKPYQAPVLLSFVAAQHGYVPPDLGSPYSYCELGCSTGATLNVLAAANPDSSFVGIDFNAAHIREAADTALRAGLGNVRYIKSAFEDLKELELGKFDFVTTHGTFSWLGQPAVDAMLQFLATQLQDNGLFYLEYNTFPGDVAVGPMWRLMRELTANLEMDSASRAEAGLDILSTLCEARAGIFTAFPNNRETVLSWKTALKTDAYARSNLAHIALSEDWHSRYVSDVMSQFSQVGLQRAGSAELLCNDQELMLDQSHMQLVDGLQDPRLVELVKDFIHSRQVRYDIFCKGTPEKQDADGWLKDNIHVTPTPLFGDQTPAVMRWDGTRVPLDREVDRALRRAIKSGVTPLTEIAKEDEAREAGLDELTRAVSRLLSTGLCNLCKGPPVQVHPPRGDTVKLSIPANYNWMRLETANSELASVMLAAPVTGSVTDSIGPVMALLLENCCRLDFGNVVGETVATLEKKSAPIIVGGREVNSARLDLQFVAEQLQRFLRVELPYLVRMGAVTLES